MKRFTRVLIVGVMALFLILPTVAFANGTAEQGAAGGAKKYKVAVSMSYIGNDWQGVSRNIITAMWQLKYKDKISTVDVYVAGTDAANQNRQLLQMIAQKYDMIICYPISPTALDNSIQKAVDAGIVFMTYDAEVTNKGAYQVTFDQYDAASRAAEWLAKAMSYKGNVVLDSGVPGTTVDTLRNKGATDVFAKYPDMKIVAQFWGMWANGPSEEGMAKVLAAGTKVDGVWGQGGGAGIVKAMLDAKVPLVPMAGESENQIRLMMLDPALKAKGFSACSYGSPLYQGAAALEYGLKILDGDKSIPHKILIPYDWQTGDTLKLTKTGSAEDLMAGASVFSADLVGPGFFADWYHKDFTPGLDLNMALTGLVPQNK
jgi:ribose transport system substrate-binding protein